MKNAECVSCSLAGKVTPVDTHIVQKRRTRWKYLRQWKDKSTSWNSSCNFANCAVEWTKGVDDRQNNEKYLKRVTENYKWQKMLKLLWTGW